LNKRNTLFNNSS
jgi:hypothetical protein